MGESKSVSKVEENASFTNGNPPYPRNLTTSSPKTLTRLDLAKNAKPRKLLHLNPYPNLDEVLNG